MEPLKERNMTYLPTLRITAVDLDHSGRYIGDGKVSDWPGHIEIDADLGTVCFTGSVVAAGNIVALAGSGVEAAGSIKAGRSINADTDIKAGADIEAVLGIIMAGSGIEAGRGTTAGSYIVSGGGIMTGLGIEAVRSIFAGLGIKAKWISCGEEIHAGLSAPRRATPKDKQIRAEIRNGTVARGEHVPPVKPSAACRASQTTGI